MCRRRTHCSKRIIYYPRDIDPSKLWLLEEGHCFRSQIMNLANAEAGKAGSYFEYEAGSIETLAENGGS